MTYSCNTNEIIYNDPNAGVRGSHKFYRATVIWAVGGSGGAAKVLYQWGRIGAKGDKQIIDYPTVVAAKAAAEKKIRDKESNGYGHGVWEHFPVCPEDLLETAFSGGGYVKPEAPTVVGNSPTELRLAVFAGFSDNVGKARRLAMGTQKDATEAVLLRNDLRTQLKELADAVTVAGGELEFVEEIIQMQLGA